MPEKQYWLLIEISSIHSEKVINALRDYMVLGGRRKDVCERYGVSQSYFSCSLKRFLYIHQVVGRLVFFYMPEKNIPYAE
ncbi:TPA: PapB/FocB family fimbrial expression transcriptional regulator [Escherichia coli]